MKGIKAYHYALSYVECSIRIYRPFTTIFHKCLILLLIFILHFSVMLALHLMLLMTHYAQSYAGIIGRSLPTGTIDIIKHFCRIVTSWQYNTIATHNSLHAFIYTTLLYDTHEDIHTYAKLYMVTICM